MRIGTIVVNTKTNVFAKVVSVCRGSDGAAVVVVVKPQRADGQWSGISRRWDGPLVRSVGER